MPDSNAKPKPNPIGIGSDHGGFELKQHLTDKLRTAGHEVVDFGDREFKAHDHYPDFIVALARAVAGGEVERGVAICGSGVGATVTANGAERNRRRLAKVAKLESPRVKETP